MAIMKFLSTINKQLRNPAYGLLPLLFFSFGIRLLNEKVAISIALALSIIGFSVVKKHSRLIYDVSFFAFSIGFLFLFVLTPSLNRYYLFFLIEVLFVFALLFFRLSRHKIIHKFSKKNKNPLVKNYVWETFRVSFQVQYGLTAHLLVVLSYFILKSIDISILSPSTLNVFALLFLICIIFMEFFRLWILDRKLHQEEWLPVVNQNGNVMGKIAKSVTKGLKNKFMHPVVRIALIYDGKIYLKKRPPSRLLNPGLLDYPFEKYMQFEHKLDEAVHNSIKSECQNDNIPIRFMLKYVFENKITKRLIFLYVSVIENDAVFNNLCLEEGKLWTISQIEDNLGQNVFSECFEMEFEYLKNTVLFANQLKNKKVMA